MPVPHLCLSNIANPHPAPASTVSKERVEAGTVAWGEIQGAGGGCKGAGGEEGSGSLQQR